MNTIKPSSSDSNVNEVAVILVALGLLLAAPTLAIIALVRLGGLERRLRSLELRLGEVSKGPRVEPPAPTPAGPRPPAATPSPAPPRQGVDIETWIAGRGLNRIGIVALLMATAFFLKYAFDNEWIGERGRIAIGLLAGASLLAYSQWLLGRGLRYFSDGIAGLGAGVLYLSIYAAWSFYHLIPHSTAFVGMIIVTTAIVAIAVGGSSERLALVALAGGFLTPGLLSTGRDAQLVLFSYLAILNAGFLALASLRGWRTLPLAALIPTLIYYWGWEDRFYSADKLLRTVFFASLFFIEFSAAAVAQARKEAKLHWEQVLLVLLNASGLLFALRELLYDEHRWALTVAVLVLAAAHLAVVEWLPARKQEKPSTPRLIFAGLALTFVTLAIPIRLEGKWITMAWAVEGAILIWSGFRAGTGWLRAAGLLLQGVVTFRLLFFHIPAERFLLNPRFATFAVAVAGFAVSCWFARKNEHFLGGPERGAFGVLAVAVNLFAVMALSFEVWDLFGRMPPDAGVDRMLARQLGLSSLWTVYATGLIFAGVRAGRSVLRWQGLALLGLAVGKVFLYDLSSLERAYRIASFVVLGFLLLVVSFYYQRKLATGGGEEDS